MSAYKVGNTAYAMREDENMYAVLRLLPLEEYFHWYLERLDEIECNGLEPWLRIFISDDSSSALAFVESVIGKMHRQGGDDTLIA